MSSIDNRVVKMLFDNEEFEKKAGTTLDTLDKLKKSLDFSGAAKGMEEIEKSANGVDFSALAEGIEALQYRFSVMGEFVHNMFMNMVNSAIDAGKKIADALAITPAKEGFAEYELKMGSIQTIMAATGADLDTVNQKLNALNEYADKTIYSFSDMTSSIGKFTNAGVDLDTAVSAIEGISNAAALAGADTHQASSAMFNLSQALSAGYLGLVDWRSINLTAGIGTETFRRQLIDTALAMGTLREENGKYISTTTDLNDKVSDAFDVFEGFDNSLSHRWATKDVIMQAMKNFGTDIRELSDTERDAYETELMSLYGDEEKVKAIMELGKSAADAAKDVKTFSQLIDTLKEALGTGWATSWEYVFGDFEEAKKLWTDIYKVLESYINASSDARNKMLKEWSEGGGRKALIDSLWNSFNALLSVLTPIKEAWDSIFPAVKAKDLIKYSEALRDFTAGLKLTENQISDVKEGSIQIFTSLKWGFEGIINVGKTVLDVLRAIGTGIKNAINASDIAHVGELTARFKDFSEKIRPSEKALKAISSLVTGMVSVFRALASVAIDAGSALYDGFIKIIGGVIGDGEDLLDLIINIGNSLTNFAESFEKTFNLDMWSGGFGNIADALLNLWEAAKNFLNLDDVIEWFKNFFDVTKGAAPSIDLLDILATLFSKLTSAFADFTSKIDLAQLDFGKVLNLAANVALFKKIYKIFKDIEDKLNSDVPKTWLTSLKDTFESVFKGVGDLLITFKNSIIDVVTAIDKEVKANVFKKVAISFAVLVASLWVLSTIDTKKLATAVAGLTALMVEIGALMTYISGLNFTNLRSLSTASSTLIKMGVALLILAAAVKMIGSMEPQQVSEGILAVTILLAEMAAVAKMFSNMDKNLSKGAVALIAFAIGIKILAGAVKILGDLDPNAMMAGLIGISILIGELVAVAHGLSDLKGLPAAGLGLLILSAAIKVLASVVKDFAGMNFDQLMNGLIGLAGVLAIVVASAKGLDAIEGIGRVAVSLLIFSASIKVLESVVTSFASLSEEQLVQGIVGVASVMGSLVLAAKALERVDVKSLLGSMVGLLLFVGVIESVANVVVQLSAIPFDQMIVGLSGLAAIMIGLAAAAVVFSSDAIDPAKISGVGNALLAFSLSVGIMAASLKLLSTIPWQALLVSLGAIVAMFVIIGGATAILGPMVPVMISLAGAFALFGLSALAFGAGVALAATGIATLVAAVAAGGLSLAEIGRQFLDLLAKAGEAFANMFVGFITTLAEQGPVLVEAIAQIIQTVLTAIMETIPMITETLFTLLSELLTQFSTYIPQMASMALQLISAFLQEIAANLPAILEAAITICIEFINGIAEKLPDIIDAAFNLIISFIDGLATAIDNHHDELWEVIGHLILSIAEAILDGIPKVIEVAGQLLLDIQTAIKDSVSNMYDAACDLVQGFIDGLWDGVKGVWDAACNLASTAWNAITGTLDEHSPSRVTFGGGVNFVQGFINGIESLRSSSATEAGAVAYAAVSALEAGLDNVNTEFTPKYTPVIDASEIQNGVNGVINMMDTIPATYGITADLTSQNRMKAEMLDLMSSGQDFSEIVGSIDRLNRDMAAYTDAVTNMQMVMDTGTLVGQLTPGLDQSLGRNAILTRRGV